MGFERYVEVGRAVVVTYGPNYGKLAVIVEIIDHGRVYKVNKVLIEGPEVTRQSISFKRATLTSVVISIPRGVGSKALAAAFIKQDLQGKWSKTSWAKKFDQREKRAALNDFGRFKVMLARKKKSAIVGKGFAKLRTKQ